MKKHLMCKPDTAMEVVLTANTIRIHFTPVGACSPTQTFVPLKVSNFSPKNGFRIRVPWVLQKPCASKSNDQRVDITFRPTLGQSLSFKAFIFDKLADETQKWLVFKNAFDWFARKQAWKKDVINAWLLHPASRKEFTNICKPCKRARSPSVLASIPVNWFTNVCSITLRLEPCGKLTLYVPKRLTDPHSQKNNNFKLNFKRCKKTMANPSDMRKFGEFVADYIRTAVLNWRTRDEVKSWADNREVFADLVTKAWLSCYRHRFWVIKPSQVAATKQFANLPKGSGLFCTVEGMHRIFFGDRPLSHWIKYKVDKGSIEERYAIGGKQRVGYTYFLPTDESFKTGVIHPGFKVCHSETTPTHTLCFSPTGNFYYLEPNYRTCPGDEFTFNYYLKDVFNEND